MMTAEESNLLYRISCLEQDVRVLSDMNKALAWELNDKSSVIEELRNQIRYFKDITGTSDGLQ
jgi:hypothetical protein